MSVSVNPPVGPVALSSNARTVLEKRYLVKNEKGKPVEQPEDLFWRVATVVAEADRRYGATDEAIQQRAEDFYFLMTQRRFEPNSPTLMNAGRPLGQLSACFVLPVEDALSNHKNGIYDTLASMALIHQSGGGTGFSFSRLRPKGSMVRSTTGVASGPVSFMKLYLTPALTRSSRAGRAAAPTWAFCASITRTFSNSSPARKTSRRCRTSIFLVAMTSKFMDAVKRGESYDLIDPSNNKVVGQLDAATWCGDKMIAGAWRTGEPGCFFIDEANRYNPVPHLGAYEATNPCGEQLRCWRTTSATFGSINVGASMWIEKGVMDWRRSRRDVQLSTRFLDNIIDVNKYPLPEIDSLSKRIRRIGLGLMRALPTCSCVWGSPTTAPKAWEMGRRVMEFLDVESKKESQQLAEERGPFS